jgi:glucose-1-phosphate adenylyltransferase
MRNIITLVLGGGRGARLFPLTQFRSKPAVPLAGKYRLIDIPLSNCINSGLDRIYVLTQFNSVSLHRHIRRTYTFDMFGGGFVEILAAQQTLDRADWYQGTADAVRQHVRYLQDPEYDHVLILSGDQLYRMNFRDMMETHRRTRADVTIAALPVSRESAPGLGIMRIDDTGRVVGFLEKPQSDDELSLVYTDPAWIDARGIANRGRPYLASMGIYLFNRDTLVDVLTKTSYHDFGKEIFPASFRTRRVFVHLFDGYWEDIGTVKSFHRANLELAAPRPSFELGSAVAPIYSRARFLPPSRVDGATLRRSLVADGCIIDEGAVIDHSVIGLRVHIGPRVTVRHAVVMGSDAYTAPGELAADALAGRPPIGIGAGSHLEGVIVDKNCRIGRNVRIVPGSGLPEDGDRAPVFIRDGIVVVPKDAVLPDGWTL